MTNTHGFTLIREQAIPELNSKARLFRHDKTGAQLLSLENDDTNKCFGISFFTPVESSNGVAHIMEHSVLRGSQKYPLKDPFAELIKGSLATFINAFTFADKTIYPAASENLRDFYNLVDVYFDTVFHALIPPQALREQGWHYELEDESGPLIYKGVVFNEMKGAYSSPDDLLGRYSQESLFPGTPYGVSSGGDPKAIPALTYDEFKRFYEEHYHPSNALIYFYGDDDPDTRLRLADQALSAFEPRLASHQPQRQKPFAAPKRLTFPFAANGDEQATNKAMVTVNWVLTDTDNAETHVGLEILNYLLTGTPASPLRKALLDSGLGEGLAGGGIDDQVCQMVFSTGLKGIAPTDAEKVETLILDTLRSLTERGIDPATIEAAINTVEFQLREANTGSFPRGLVYLINILSTWQYEGDPLATVAFEQPLNAIKGKANQGYFEGLIKTYLVDNPHRTTVLLTPDPELGQQLEQEEADRLARIRAAMSPDEVAKVIADTAELKRIQDTPDSPETLAALPSLSLADLDKQVKTIPIALSDDAEGQIVYHDLFTNGIVYVDVGLDLHVLPPQYLPYVNLFSRALLEMGTSKEDYVKLSERIGRKTGGIRPVTQSATHLKTHQAVTNLFLRGKATVPQTGELLAILNETLKDAQFDNRERFKQIVLEEKAQSEAQLLPLGHVVAMNRLFAHFHEDDWANEQIDGLSYLFFLRKLLSQIDNDWTSVCVDLEAMRRLLLNRRAMVINVTVDADNWGLIVANVSDFLDGFPLADKVRAAWTPGSFPANEGLTIPSQVNFVAKGADLYALGYQLHGSERAIFKYLDVAWLWEKVRVQGGAYGCFSRFNFDSGSYVFVSYRDPNLLKTLDVFDATPRFLRELKLSESELTRAIVGAVGQIDRYELPDAKGYRSLVWHLMGETDDDRQKRRDELLATSPADFKRFADVLEGVITNGQVVVLGSAEDVAAANAARGDFLKVTGVM